MALALRLRRAAAISSSFLKDRLFSPIPSSPAPLSKPCSTPPFHGNPNPSSIPHSLIRSQSFRSSTPFSNRRTDFSDREGEINPDEILFEGCDYNHWLITMDFPKDPEPTREEKIEAFVQTCAKVVGSVEEAKKRIYSCSTTTYTGFNAVMTEEMSEKFSGLPGVVFILPDSYIDPVNKEYGGDKYENGVITPRPPPIQYQSRGRYEKRPRFDGQREPFPARQGNPPQGNEISNTRQQNYGQSGQDGRGYGPPRGRDFAPSGDNRDFGQGQPRDRAQVGGRDPVPSHQRDFGQGQQWNSAPQEQRNFSQGQGRDYRNADPSLSGDYRQRSAPGSSLNYSQGAGPGYSRDFGHSGDNRQGTGYGSGVDFRQGSGSGYRNADPSVLGDYRQGSAPGSSLNYSQGAGPDYSGEYKQGPNFGHSGDNRQGTGSGYGADIRQGSGSGYGKNYPGSIEDKSEPWQGKY